MIPVVTADRAQGALPVDEVVDSFHALQHAELADAEQAFAVEYAARLDDAAARFVMAPMCDRSGAGNGSCVLRPRR
jgi:predicted dinucleotide-binding enzyme